MKRLLPLTLVMALSAPLTAVAETYLYMAEEVGCMWCARWHEEIGPIYPKTAEGETAPLRTFDLHRAVPADVEFDRRIHFTPTFVLVRDGAEVARIEGYPGEDFFWGLLSMALEEANIQLGGVK